MRKKRVQGSSRKTSASERIADSIAHQANSSVPCRRFLGVSLSGGKSDKACVAVLEYFPDQKKVFLSQLLEKIKAEEFISADLKIHEIISQYKNEAELVGFDVPLSLPKCTLCDLPCPGYEVCTEPEIKFIRGIYQAEVQKKKPKKMYTPYTQRAVDAHLSFHHSEMDVHHALGANLAPLTTRGMFIARRSPIPSVEVFVKLSVQILGQQLKVNKSKLKIYRNSVGGEEAREIFLNTMTERWQIFFYRQDMKSMIENFHAFEAFISAYTAFLSAMGKTEARPSELPASESWVSIPKS